MNALSDFDWIDIHYHASPDLYRRRHNAIEAGKRYQGLNAAVVLKSHLGGTAVQATLCQSQGLPVLPSLVLNAVAGGIDFRVVLRELAHYIPQIAARMIVHLPTITGRAYPSKIKRTVLYPNYQRTSLQAETVFDSNHKIKAEVLDVLKMSRDYPVVISTGHCSLDEFHALVDACLQHGVDKLLLNQPAHPLLGLSACDLSDLNGLDWLFIEQTALTYFLKHQSELDFNAVLTRVNNVVYSSDLGQTSMMDIDKWQSFSKQHFEAIGLSADRQQVICRENAIRLLTLE